MSAAADTIAFDVEDQVLDAHLALSWVLAEASEILRATARGSEVPTARFHLYLKRKTALLQHIESRQP